MKRPEGGGEGAGVLNSPIALGGVSTPLCMFICYELKKMSPPVHKGHKKFMLPSRSK